MLTPSNSPRKIIRSKDSDSLSTVDLNREESKNDTVKASTIVQLSNAMMVSKSKGKHYHFFSWQAKKKLLNKKHHEFLENPNIDTLIDYILIAKIQRTPKLNSNHCTKSIKNLTTYFEEIPDLARFIQELPDEMNENDMLLLRRELFSYFPELNMTILTCQPR